MDFDRTDSLGAREGFRDQVQALGTQVVFYPEIAALLRSSPKESSGLFIGAGVAYEETITGYQRERDAITWVRPNNAERFDLWRGVGRHVLTTQTIGYRHTWAGHITVSMRLMVREVIHGSTELEKDAIHSLSPDLMVKDREAVSTSLVFLTGIAL